MRPGYRLRRPWWRRLPRGRPRLVGRGRPRPVAQPEDVLLVLALMGAIACALAPLHLPYARLTQDARQEDPDV